ncbi:MAG TPA: hypothetical protein VKT78_14965 [Fimbriimonadaceae bacterium]|nr:hypothetical protein [Fimbriimonadaceae bacterium]
MAVTKRFMVAAMSAACTPAVASDIGVDFLNANLYKRVEHATRGPRTFADWMDQNIVKRVSVAGSEKFTMHFEKTEGDLTAYQNATDFGQGNQVFTNIGMMTVSGSKVAGLFSFSTSFADNHYQDPTARRISLNYAKNGLSVDAGNIYASLIGGNQFLTFRRSLWGVEARLMKGPFQIAALGSQQRSSATTTSFSGNNSSGPYYLNTSQINPDSVRVQVDGKELNYPADFTVNAVIGSITFTTLSIPPTSTIVASFETTGVNSGGGTITGLGGMYTFGKWGTLGAMEVRQTDPSVTGLTTYVDRYQGFGDPSTPYFLQYQPLASRPVIVTLDGIVQVPNVDYQFSTSNPTVFYFLRYVPTTSTVTVTYTPAPTTSLRGNRQVEAFNYTFPFGRAGRNGGITYSEAFSSLDNPVSPTHGTARGLAATYKLKNFNFTGSVDDIPQTFVGIDSTGFLRNERASSAGVEYRAKRMTFNLNGSNSAIASEASDPNGNLTFIPSRTTRLDAGARYRGSDGLTWSLDQQHLTSWTVQGAAHADQSSFTLSKLFGRLENHFDLGHTQGFGPISNGITSSLGDVKLNSIGWRGDYAASKGWVFGGHLTLSQINTDGTNGKGTDTQMSLSYRPPAGKFGFDAHYDYSNSGTIATLGAFQDGTGLGYNGNGFSGALPTSSGLGSFGGNSFNAGGTNLRRFQTSTNWMITKRASIGANFMTGDESGAISSNSTTTAEGMSLNYDLHNGQMLSFSLDQSNSVFPESVGTARSLSLNGYVGGRPKGRWSYRLGFGSLLSSGGTIAQNSFHYDMTVRHFLKQNQAVGFDINSSSLTNYQPQNDFQIAAVYEYKLFGNVSVVGRYQIHTVTNLDPTVNTGAFRSHGFDLELNFNFGS